MKRRNGLRVAMAAGLLWLAGQGAPALADKTAQVLTVLTWGGAYEAAQRAAYFDPFTEATGIRVRTVHYDGGLQPLRDRQAAEAGSWDLVDMVHADAKTACVEGLLAPLEGIELAPAPDGASAHKDFIPGAFSRCGIMHLVFSTVIAYDDRAFPGLKPRTVSDFFDLERFPGKRAVRRVPVGILEWALMSYRVPRQQLYDLLSTRRGFDLAFRRLDRIRDQIEWWTAGDQPARWLASGDVVMATGFNGRFFHAQVAQGAPITVIWQGQLLDYNSWTILEGSDQPELARRFLRFATRTESMAALANRISYGPTRASARQRVGLHVDSGVPMRRHLPTAEAHLREAIRRDHDWYARTAELRERLFNDWLDREPVPLKQSDTDQLK